MNDKMPSRLELKNQAKWRMGQAMKAYSVLALLLVMLEIVLNSLSISGAIPLYYWAPSEQSIQTGMSLSAEGFFAALRVEEVDMGISVAITPGIALTFLLVQLAVTAVAAPLRMGCLEHTWSIFHGMPRPLKELSRWYLELRRAGQAVLLEAILLVVKLALTLVFLIPAILTLWRADGDLNRISIGLWMILGAMACAWCVMTQLKPARYLLGRNYELGALGALRECARVLRTRRGAYFTLCLSFAVMEFLAYMTRGVFNLYLFPYQSLTNMLWLEAVEASGGEVWQR